MMHLKNEMERDNPVYFVDLFKLKLRSAFGVKLTFFVRVGRP